MKRRVIQLVLLFVLLISAGAIVNVAVAWILGGSAEFGQVDEDPALLHAALRHWQKAAPAHWPASPSHTFFVGDAGVLNISMCQPDPERLDVGTVLHRFHWWQSGWPLHGMQGFAMYEYGGVGGFTRQRGVLLWFDAPINFLPLWPGFAINTIFYAAILWMVFFVPGRVKRTLRRRRGECPASAYPVGTSDVCTECGAALLSSR